MTSSSVPHPTPAGGDTGSRVPGSRVIDEQAARIGSRIRSLRRSHDMTLVQLAALTGLSHPFLSQLERGHARPSMVSLERIARALGSSQVELLAAADLERRSPGDTRPDVLRATEGVRGPFAEGEARLLAHGARGFEPLEFIGANTDPGDYYEHEEDEFIYVMRGSILVDLADRGRFVLDAGDSIYYYGGTPHRWNSLSGDGYHLFLVKQKAAQS
ncbi:MAG: helix-turn-helix domain-containing protein [Leifsonia sp.]|jgi:transcriptional regulator with XRE-family HTH domain